MESFLPDNHIIPCMNYTSTNSVAAITPLSAILGYALGFVLNRHFPRLDFHLDRLDNKRSTRRLERGTRRGWENVASGGPRLHGWTDPSKVGSVDDDDDEERERDEGSAREFAGRLKHGSAVGRPQTPKLASLPLRPTLPRPPSAPRTDKGWQGAQRA